MTPGTPWLTAVDPTLAFRKFQLLKLEYYKLLSNFAFKCKLRHYTQAPCTLADVGAPSVRRCRLTPV